MDRRPNVLLILADDLGAECLSSYGGTSYATPNLDALAAGGVRFEYAFATPVCTPSRVQLLTGLYPFRTGWTHGSWTREDADRRLDASVPSVARRLRDAGYVTAAAGKWQLCEHSDIPRHARELGFDEYCLWNSQGEAESPYRRYYDPPTWESGRDEVVTEHDTTYGPDLFTEFLIDFIERHRDERWFAYYPMVLVHRPYVTPDTSPGATGFVDQDQDDAVRFAAHVAYMDRLVGRLVAALERLGLAEETLVLFTADNGTDHRLTSEVGGMRVRGGKARLTESGAAVPLISSWPGTAPAGAVNRELVDFTDVFPTLLEVAGARAPDMLDGRSFAGALRGEPRPGRDWVWVQLGDEWFLRGERWRLHDDGRLFDVSERFLAVEVPVEGRSDEASRAAQRLSDWAEELRASR